jgi:hypothetical protein
VTDAHPFGPRTEAGMFQGFDHVVSRLPSIRGADSGMCGSGISARGPVHPTYPLLFGRANIRSDSD